MSCFLYILVIDPLLHKIRKHPGVLQLSAFADDWTIACLGLLPLFSLRPIIRAFEIASGQEINEPKSGIIPSRQLSHAETLCCLVHWRNIQILYRTRILGLIIGLHATIEDQYSAALDKFAQALLDFSSLRQRMSFAMRLAVINVFLFSLFSFVNRFFYMPTRILHNIESQVLSFLSRIPFARLGIFAHARKLYGINTAFRDLRLSNISAILSTYIHKPYNVDCLVASLRNVRASLPPGGYAHVPGRPPPRLEHPTYSWLCARSFFVNSVGQAPDETYERALPSSHRRASLDLELPSIESTLYHKLLQQELPHWRAYLADRVTPRGWNRQLFLQGLFNLPKQLSQSHRWHLARLHLNGHMTSHRLHAAHQAPAILPCALCNASTDTAGHLFACPAVTEAFAIMAPALPVHANHPGSLSHVFFNTPTTPDHFHLILATFTAAWACRGALRRGNARTRLPEFLIRCIQHPYLLAGGSASKRERRLARVSPPKPLPHLAGLYQADGALALNPQQVLMGAWGAAWWEAGVGRASPPTASAAGLCPDPCTNNIAEFFGLRECLRRALRNPGRLLIFELDSMLVVMMMSGIWGCHRAHLRPLLAECYDMAEGLTALGCQWVLRHVYREYNKVADKLAGDCIQDPATAGPSPLWSLQ